MIEIVPHSVFMGIATVIIVGTCASWLVVEYVNLRRTLRETVHTPERHDRIFGSIIGAAIMVIGLVGVVKYYWF